MTGIPVMGARDGLRQLRYRENTSKVREIPPFVVRGIDVEMPDVRF